MSKLKIKDKFITNVCCVLSNQIVYLNGTLQETDNKITLIQYLGSDDDQDESVVEIEDLNSKAIEEESNENMNFLNTKRKDESINKIIKLLVKHSKDKEMTETDVLEHLLNEYRILKKEMKDLTFKKAKNFDILNYICKQKLRNINQANPSENRYSKKRLRIAEIFKTILETYQDEKYKEFIEQIKIILINNGARYDYVNDEIDLTTLFSNKLNGIMSKLIEIKNKLVNSTSLSNDLIQLKNTTSTFQNNQRTDFKNNIFTDNSMSNLMNFFIDEDD